jgi:hypothetical protein
MTAVDRFMERVTKRIVVVNGKMLVCWIWTGGKSDRGYGLFYLGNGKYIRAHVWSYRHFIGPVPKGKGLDHYRCWNRACVNPAHVRPATQLENVRNAKTHNSVKLQCDNGHPFTPENTRLVNRSRGGVERVCIICERQRGAAYRQRKRDKRHGTD